MHGRREIRNLALIGFMGTGKSSVGRLVAARLRFELVDTDALIEAQAGRTISQIFAELGEAAFRRLEKQVVAQLAHRDRLVISTGGGLGADPENLAQLKRHALVVCLWARPAIIWQRVRRQKHRPLLLDPDPMARITALLARREPVYRRADLLLNTEWRSAAEVAREVLRAFRLARQSPPPP